MVEVVVVQVEDLRHILLKMVILVVQVVVLLLGDLKLDLEEPAILHHLILHKALQGERLDQLKLVDLKGLLVAEVDSLLLAQMEHHFFQLMSVPLAVLEFL
jgi:hypothetical protein